MPRPLSEELERTLRARLSGIDRHVADLRGRLGRGNRRLALALELIRNYPPYLRAAVHAEWQVTTAEVDRVNTLRGFLAHAVDVEGLLESWLIQSVEAPAPMALTRAVERECHELGQDRVALLAVGPADNFATYVDELPAKIFNASARVDPPASVSALPRFALLQLPRLHMDDPSLWPVVVGHETAHLGLLTRPLAACLPAFAAIDWAGLIAESADAPAEENERKTWQLAAEQQATYWAEELLCDAYAVRRFGPAAVAAMGSVLEALGAIDQASDTHPDPRLRLRLMLRWVGRVTSPRLRALLEPWEQATAAGATPYDAEPDRLIAGQLGDRLADEFPAALTGWPAGFDVPARLPLVQATVTALRGGRLPLPNPLPDPVPPHLDAEIITAGWVALVEDPAAHPGADPGRQVTGRLVSKALDAAEFVRQWRSAEPAPAGRANRQGLRRRIVDRARVRDGRRGVDETLTPAELLRRLEISGARGLYVAPMLPHAVSGAGVDLRLGSRFVVFERSGTLAIDPLSELVDPRSMQVLVEKPWGEQFVLHPGELVLASTLEYVVMPADLAGQVVMRPSYGRLGLVLASAVLVPPGLHGCLTLGLVNLGGVPLRLTPGERIAQLTVRVAQQRPAETGGQPDYPTGPEVSPLPTDPDIVVLRQLRSGGWPPPLPCPSPQA